MLKLSIALLFLGFSAGCATTPYNPVQSAASETFLLNEGLKGVQIGMTQEHVHEVTGQELVIGYDYQNPGLKETAGRPKPLTVVNPYRTKTVQTAQGACTIEYYVTAIHNPDGVISEDELLPLTFCKGVLTAKGPDNSQ